MAKNRWIAPLVALVMLAQLAFAYDSPLSHFGFEGISIGSPSDRNCWSYDFSVSGHIEGSQRHGIISVKASFDGPQNDNSYVTVRINGGTPKVFWPENFSCGDNGCWARVFAEELANDSTAVELCIATGNETSGAALSENSYIGFYDTPVITIETAAPKNVILGDQVKLSTVLRNAGSKDVDIFAQFIHPDTRSLTEITSFDIVQGDSSASTTLKAGDTKTFNYYIKPTLPSGYNLPYAVVFFDNVFGEKQALTSSHPQMVVSSPQQIEVSVIGTDVSGNAENFVILKAVIRNLWNEQFEGEILMSPADIVSDANQEIIVSPLGEQEVIFQTKNLSPGSYQFSAMVSDSNHTYTSNTISSDVKKPAFPIEIVLALIGIVAAIIVLYWVYVAKAKK
jgi:hypothetical protein